MDLLTSYTRIEILRKEFEKVVHVHSLKDPDFFNDDPNYKDLLNEVLPHISSTHKI